MLPLGELSFLLFPVAEPQRFDAVLTRDGLVSEIQVKADHPGTHWVWGAFRMPGQTLSTLQQLWCERHRKDEYMGTLVNEYINRGGAVHAVKKGELYVDVGTLHGYHEALRVLSQTELAHL